MKKAKASRRYEITDSGWERIYPALHQMGWEAGGPSGDNRTALNGMLWINRTGAPWEDLPSR